MRSWSLNLSSVFGAGWPGLLFQSRIRSPVCPVQGAPAPASSIAFSLRWAFSKFIPSAAQHICACTLAVPEYLARAKWNLRFIVPKACSTLKQMLPILVLKALRSGCTGLPALPLCWIRSPMPRSWSHCRFALLA